MAGSSCCRHWASVSPSIRLPYGSQIPDTLCPTSCPPDPGRGPERSSTRRGQPHPRPGSSCQRPLSQLSRYMASFIWKKVSANFKEFEQSPETECKSASPSSLSHTHM